MPSHEAWKENNGLKLTKCSALTKRSLTETEAGLRAQLHRRALASSQDPGTPQRAISRSPKILRHESNRACDEATHGELPRRQELCQTR